PAAPAVAVLRQRYPRAWEYVEAAARAGQAGDLVRSWLGRACPPAPDGWGENRAAPAAVASPEARARGRFTRNFIIQATAAEWALVLLARARLALAGSGARIVLFQHDELVVHCPAARAEATVGTLRRAGDEAGRLLFGSTPVRFPLEIAVVECYADAK
ncbi:MAG: bifunctional 3'-5' exonuclease/DNA polymerase, partial [Dactylosporangium sp.]|nr:bifunctional 3'-5' exonuclease/DNA polymerase [Dactylosporangium sp.]NNJ60600.1 bifunctional 3'-5' exonuclease/DNA polymerase [Dactylosporangium sp.]